MTTAFVLGLLGALLFVGGIVGIHYTLKSLRDLRIDEPLARLIIIGFVTALAAIVAMVVMAIILDLASACWGLAIGVILCAGVVYIMDRKEARR